MKVCAGIVLYRPDAERLRQNIDSVLPQVSGLVFVNNAPEEAGRLRELLPGTLSADKIISWIDNGSNLGIAAALNQIMTYAQENGYRWVLTLDQDGICGENMVEKLWAATRKYPDAAMVSPRIAENGLLWEDGVHTANWKKADAPGGGTDIEDILFCITSGTLTNAAAVMEAGGFDERLFIDEVDRDICIRLRRNGRRILRVNDAVLEHEFGVELVERKILFKTYKYRNYPPFRVYYQIRNLVYMVRKYGSEYKTYPAWRLIRPFLTFAVKFIFEPQRLARLSAFFRGYAAGLTMKLQG